MTDLQRARIEDGADAVVGNFENSLRVLREWIADLTPAAGSEPGGEERDWSAWLIEREPGEDVDGQQPEYWAGSTRWGVAVRQDWTIDPFKARHFPTEAEAAAVIGDRLGFGEPVMHGFTGYPTPPTEASVAEIAAGLTELGTGGTPAFIRGYNRGFEDAWEQATPPSSVAERGGLEDAIGRLVGVAGTIAGHRGGMTFEGFYHHPYWWADLDAALAEVQQAREAAATPVAERGGLRALCEWCGATLTAEDGVWTDLDTNSGDYCPEGLAVGRTGTSPHLPRYAATPVAATPDLRAALAWAAYIAYGPRYGFDRPADGSPMTPEDVRSALASEGASQDAPASVTDDHFDDGPEFGSFVGDAT